MLVLIVLEAQHAAGSKHALYPVKVFGQGVSQSRLGFYALALPILFVSSVVLYKLQHGAVILAPVYFIH